MSFESMLIVHRVCCIFELAILLLHTDVAVLLLWGTVEGPSFCVVLLRFGLSLR